MRLEKFCNQNIEKQDSIIIAGVEEFSRKSYSDASTDVIVQGCGISKGLLFHYFGSKKDFYLYCLSRSLEKLMERTDTPQGSFYEILFAVMDGKLRLCARYPSETKFVNMASREASSEVEKGKKELFAKYASQMHAVSVATMGRALATLSLKPQRDGKAKEGLLLYSNAIVNKYLHEYQSAPEQFFKIADRMQAEIKEYIDLMLYGII